LAGVTLSQVRKSYGATRVIDGLSLAVEAGEFLVLLGPSGCGKSTLLRMIAGLESVDDGEIHIGDRRVDLLPPGARASHGLPTCPLSAYERPRNMASARNAGMGGRIERRAMRPQDARDRGTRSQARPAFGASAGASPLPARSSRAPALCSASRCRTSTRRCASAPGLSSPLPSGFAPRPSSSPRPGRGDDPPIGSSC
jgi:energy-coupling factor transporter ATP-binding protein EcfA2